MSKGWAIIMGHPSLCSCPDCQAMRVVGGYDLTHPLLTPELLAEAAAHRAKEAGR